MEKCPRLDAHKVAIHLLVVLIRSPAVGLRGHFLHQVRACGFVPALTTFFA